MGARLPGLIYGVFWPAQGNHNPNKKLTRRVGGNAVAWTLLSYKTFKEGEVGCLYTIGSELATASLPHPMNGGCRVYGEAPPTRNYLTVGLIWYGAMQQIAYQLLPSTLTLWFREVFRQRKYRGWGVANGACTRQQQAMEIPSRIGPH